MQKHRCKAIKTNRNANPHYTPNLLKMNTNAVPPT
jgi:hypothetical protein